MDLTEAGMSDQVFLATRGQQPLTQSPPADRPVAPGPSVEIPVVPFPIPPSALGSPPDETWTPPVAAAPVPIGTPPPKARVRAGAWTSKAPGLALFTTVVAIVWVLVAAVCGALIIRGVGDGQVTVTVIAALVILLVTGPALVFSRASLVADHEGLRWRNMINRDDLEWTQVIALDVRADDEASSAGMIVARTRSGEVLLPATHRRLDALQRLHADLDALWVRGRR